MRTLRGLRAGRTYEAWVHAATSAGEGPPSPAVACQTSALGKDEWHGNYRPRAVKTIRLGLAVSK